MSIRIRYVACVFTAALSIALLWAAALLAAPRFVPGGEGDGPSIDGAISADGRYVAFASAASNLVPDDGNGLQDIFLHDRETGDTFRVSVGPAGEEPNGFSESPDISADGRFVAFHSTADNLVPYDTNMETDVFLYDRQEGTVERVSLTSDDVQAAGASYDPALSADGRFVVFHSSAINLDPADTDPATDVYIRDRHTGKTALVSVDAAGNQAAGYAGSAAVSADGNIVVFGSISDALVAGDDNDVEDIFVRNRAAGTTTRVSVRSGGGQANGDSFDPAVSANGRYVAFWSWADNLTDEDTGGMPGVFVHDRQSGKTELISIAAGGGAADGESTMPALSTDGRYVVFESTATNLISGDDDGAADVFIHDRQAKTTALLSVGPEGAGNGPSARPAITPDGRYVVFHSEADNLVEDDGNGVSDVFLIDRTGGAPARVSLAAGSVAPVESAVYLGVVIR